MKTLTVPDRDLFTTDASTLFVVIGYRGREATPEAPSAFQRFLKRTPIGRWRAHCAYQAEYYANPRPLAYSLDSIGRFCATNEVKGTVRIAVDPALTEPGTAPSAVAGPVEVVDPDAAVRNPRATVIVLVYADPIGMGCERIESGLSAGLPVFVVNGRRRAFRLTPAMAKELTRRRFHTRWRLVELGLAIVGFPVSAALALSDRFGRKA
jgi:hypothetical protein